MRLIEHEDPDTFARRAALFLGAREAENNLMLGLLHTLKTAPQAYPGGFWLATVEDDHGELVGAALQTPPHALIVTGMPAAAAEEIARARPDVCGVIGPAKTAERTVAFLARAAHVHVQMRIYACAAVQEVPAAPGAMRVAEPGDTLALDWRLAFREEVREEGPIDGIVARYRALIAEGRVWLWHDDGAPVAVAAVAGHSPHGIRIGGVYTPPPLRRRGYATSLVAAVTAAQLASGRRFCFLFTDLANPTSNAIYQKIGYRPVSDVTHYRL